jgi:Tol biopolymer transport system component
MERSLIVIILIILVASVNCGEGSSDGRLETRRGDDGRELIYDPEETWGSWLFNPTISPDGSRVAFNVHFEDEIYPYGLVVLELGSGTTTVLLEEGTGNPKWSPSGEWIAYSTILEPGPLNDVYLIRPDGTGKKPAVADPVHNEWVSNWYNTQDKLVYLINSLSGDIPTGTNLGIYDESTGSSLVITEFDDRNYDYSPAVSPDGEWVAGTQIPQGDWFECSLQLTYIRTDGTNYYVEIREKDNTYFNGGVIDWSPGGKYLLFSILVIGCEYEDTELWTYDTKTGAFEQLTTAPEGFSIPGYPQVKYETVQGAEWGPDGYIYFAANNNLYRIKAPR